MEKKNKYKYIYVLKEYADGHWCEVATYDSNDQEERAELKSDAASYRAEGIRISIGRRRILNN